MNDFTDKSTRQTRVLAIGLKGRKTALTWAPPPPPTNKKNPENNMETTAKYNAQPIYTENNVPVYPNQVRQ